MNMVQWLVGLGFLLGYMICYILFVIFLIISNNAKENRELKLLNTKKAQFIKEYIQFKKEVTLWKETKKDNKW